MEKQPLESDNQSPASGKLGAGIMEDNMKLWKAFENICRCTLTVVISGRRVVVCNVADSLTIILLIIASISLADPLFVLASEYPDRIMILPAIYLFELFLLWLFCVSGDAAGFINQTFFDRS